MAEELYYAVRVTPVRGKIYLAAVSWQNNICIYLASKYRARADQVCYELNKAKQDRMTFTYRRAIKSARVVRVRLEVVE